MKVLRVRLKADLHSSLYIYQHSSVNYGNPQKLDPGALGTVVGIARELASQEPVLHIKWDDIADPDIGHWWVFRKWVEAVEPEFDLDAAMDIYNQAVKLGVSSDEIWEGIFWHFQETSVMKPTQLSNAKGPELVRNASIYDAKGKFVAFGNIYEGYLEDFPRGLYYLVSELAASWAWSHGGIDCNEYLPLSYLLRWHVAKVINNELVRHPDRISRHHGPSEMPYIVHGLH